MTSDNNIVDEVDKNEGGMNAMKMKYSCAAADAHKIKGGPLQASPSWTSWWWMVKLYMNLIIRPGYYAAAAAIYVKILRAIYV